MDRATPLHMSNPADYCWRTAESRWPWVVLLTMCLCFGPSFQGAACTVFSDSQGGTVLAGRNWDMSDEGVGVLVMWVVPARGSTFGRICFGRHGDCEDGMNDQGLFVAVAATPPDGAFKSRQAPVQCPVALEHLLAHCATVDEAIAWWEKQTNPEINSIVTRRSFLGIGGSYKNSGVGGHILMVDRRGKSVVCEWENGKLKVIRKTARYQLITNFLLSKPDVGGDSCPRFAAVTKVLNEADAPSAATCASALKASSTSLTRYSVIYDVVRGRAQIFCGGRFGRTQTIDLSEALRQGAHEVKLESLSLAGTTGAPE